MENLCLRFPTVCALIFADLDNQSLVKCRLVNKILKEAIDNEKILWNRILKKNVTNLTSDCWRKIMVNIPLEIIKETANAIQLFAAQTQGLFSSHLYQIFALSIEV